MDDQFVVLDGGTGSELSRLGNTSIDDNPLWSSSLLVSRPAIVKLAHKNFLDAGSDVVVATSYQASLDGFKGFLGVTDEEAYRLIRNSVHLARQACEECTHATGEKKRVAGSVGPYGASLHDGSEYTGAYAEKMTVEELKRWHRPRIKALLEASPDMLAIETFPIQKEAEAVVDLLSEFPGAKTWVTYACKDNAHIYHGEVFSTAVQSVIQSDSVIAVGVNCTKPEFISPLLKMLGNVSKPVIVKPNSGEKWDPVKGWCGRPADFDLTPKVAEWIQLGARWIGGCCRIYPSDIAKIKEFLSTVKLPLDKKPRSVTSVPVIDKH
ncbi:homocysteine S-methyltransferase YbgG-like [Gigantopelta aegis]|uniref:homocysteine S-methyltransferase YbgG-like n=1 Tax=Gigantopelta aegis TaxID=1735272 RepID=UPI001B88E221|nr:homocysteine S-methyltransferase YbgG-like [Gigantopelta aegis]XP_041358064.1 homocysteine S-methyltransferase YbgG-like [Gigantopelta aegis]